MNRYIKTPVYKRAFQVMAFMTMVVVITPCGANGNNGSEPAALFLTWQQDPTTTMTIDWHTTPDDDAESIIQYKKVGEEEWVSFEVDQHAFPHSDRMIHRIELTDLEPGTYYRFRVGEFDRAYKFRTMPKDLSEPVRFVTGGDTDHERHQMSAVAMQYDPDFIVWGGDLSYANGDPARIYRWYGWFDGIMNNLISDEGRVVPIVVAIGNHEYFQVRRLLIGRSPHHEHTEEEAREFMEKHNLWDMKVTFFFDLFAFPGGAGDGVSTDSIAHDVLDFSDYLSLLILDSNHVSPIEGEQTEWLEKQLQERQSIPHKFPVYHRGGYPSQRDYTDAIHTRIRDNWSPLFEKYGVRVSFENHDHAYKRTYPIRDGQIASNGVVYIGDGAWGVSPYDREIGRDEWYISKFAAERNGIVVTLHGPHQHFLMIGEEGQILDEYPRTPLRRNH